MPLYEYTCNLCHGTFEEFKRYEERMRVNCPMCRSDNVTKLYSNFSTQIDTRYKDLSGDKIWFPGPYFDTALRRKFNTVQEKKEFMDKHRIVSDGSTDIPRNNLPAEAGATRTGNRVRVPINGGKKKCVQT